MTNTTNRTAEYKGRTYHLTFLGQTKFGRRAKLQFMDGSKEFWVDASLVREVASAAPAPSGTSSRRGKRYECPECGEYVTEGDGSRCWETGCAH